MHIIMDAKRVHALLSCVRLVYSTLVTMHCAFPSNSYIIMMTESKIKGFQLVQTR